MGADTTNTGDKPADVIHIEICAAALQLAVTDLLDVAGRLGNGLSDVWRDAGIEVRHTLDEALAAHRQSWPSDSPRLGRLLDRE